MGKEFRKVTNLAAFAEARTFSRTGAAPLPHKEAVESPRSDSLKDRKYLALFNLLDRSIRHEFGGRLNVLQMMSGILIKTEQRKLAAERASEKERLTELAKAPESETSGLALHRLVEIAEEEHMAAKGEVEEFQNQIPVRMIELKNALSTLNSGMETLRNLDTGTENVAKTKKKVLSTCLTMLSAFNAVEERLDLLEATATKLKIHTQEIVDTGRHIVAYMIELTKTGELPYHLATITIDGETNSMHSAINRSVRENQVGMPLNVSYQPDENISGLKLHVDAFYIHLITMNIFSNMNRALLIARKDGKAEELEGLVTAHIHGKNVEFEFKDNGCGITKEIMVMLNNGTSVTTKSPDDGKEHGLGFQYCRELAQIMGGDLFVKTSEAGKGTVVSLILPIPSTREPTWVDHREHQQMAA